MNISEDRAAGLAIYNLWENTGILVKDYKDTVWIWKRILSRHLQVMRKSQRNSVITGIDNLPDPDLLSYPPCIYYVYV